MILCIGDAGLYRYRFISFFVQSHFFNNRTKQTFTISRVVDCKLGGKADILRLSTKNTGEDGMERSHP